MGSRVELFEQIRRAHEHEGLSIRALAERFAVHRRTVRQAIADATPPARKTPEGRPAPKLGPYRATIDGWLAADGGAPPKQRHTARRVYERLVDEHGVEVSERQVRRYVRQRRRALGEPVEEVTIPQVHAPGAEAEVDWGEARVRIAGEGVDLYIFFMRASYSGAGFPMAFERQTQQAFFEGHVEAFAFFGGSFATVRYDNLTAAVKKVLRGRRRLEQERFIALRSYYLYESSFTRPGKEGAHEKGGVEGEVGRFRRRHLVPVPEVSSLEELNRRLEGAARADLSRTITGRAHTVGEALAEERPALRGLPREPFDAAEHLRPRVDSKSLVTVKQNRYSVPVALAGLRVAARVGAREIVIAHHGREVARHPRANGRFQVVARLDHYLELLRIKPGAFAGSLPLAQERARGGWPQEFDRLWQRIEERYGRSEAARQMVDVVFLVREVGPERVALAVRGALAAGAIDGRAVALLARRETRAVPAPIDALAPHLAAHARPEPSLDAYDELRGASS
jgi:transposase